MEILIVAMREIADAGLDRAGFDKLGHRLPCIFESNLSDTLSFGWLFKKRDNHRLPFPPSDVPDRLRLAFSNTPLTANIDIAPWIKLPASLRGL